jgi:FixJ family two-component response regulator
MPPKPDSPAYTRVSIVDDDESVRQSTQMLMRFYGFETEAFASAEDFLNSDLLDCTGCLILDIRMPGMDGLELQRHLAAANRQIPIVFITGHGDGDAKRQAMKAGAVAFIHKPFEIQTLVGAVRKALGNGS